MATTVPYVSPYGRTTARARPGVNLQNPVARFLLTGLVMIVAFIAAQLALASIASTILHDSRSVSDAIDASRIKRDSLVAHVEELKSPVKVEEWAVAHGYVTVTSVQFVR